MPDRPTRKRLRELCRARRGHSARCGAAVFCLPTDPRMEPSFQRFEDRERRAEPLGRNAAAVSRLQSKGKLSLGRIEWADGRELLGNLGSWNLPNIATKKPQTDFALRKMLRSAYRSRFGSEGH